MRKSWLLCVVLGTLAWGQAAPGTPPPAQAPPAPAAPGVQRPAPQMAPAPPPVDKSASVSPSAAVITVKGVCPASPRPAAAKGATAKPAAKTPAADCKTVITKAEFEKLASALSPNVTPQMKKQLSNILPRIIALSAEAKKKGLDKSSQYEETLKFAKMQILTNELTRSVQEQASKVSPTEIADYYKTNKEAFQQYNLDRLFVPRTKQEEPAAKAEDDKGKEEKLTEEQQKAKEAAEKAKTEVAEQDMTKLAESLRARAAAGEDFVKLQKEAFEAAGMKIDSPSVNLPKVRRTGLPPAHAAVFDLKAGEVSQVINDNGGHYIYKVNSEETLPLDQVQNEIMNTLKSQHTRDATEKLNSSFQVETNQDYFGAGGMMPPPPNRLRPRMPMSPPAQPGPGGAAAPPPPAQPPAPKPN